MYTKKFLAKLFDFSFKEFITLQIIKYFFIIGIVFSALSALAILASGLSTMNYDFEKGAIGILISPIVFILLVLFIRLSLEALVATFRIAENTTKLVEQRDNPEN
jgi:hypothetical protein